MVVFIMHIAEGLLDGRILAVLWIITVIYGVIAVRKISKTQDEKKVPIQGALTAMVFAFQMLNFPISAGTSGHLMGFVLMAILTTPTAAFIMIATVLIIQAVIFADGGILALGANIFNMGIVALAGYFVYWIIRKKFSTEDLKEGEIDKGMMVASFVGAYVSLLVAAVVCGIEIGLSENFPYGVNVTIPVMLAYHVVIGIGEGLITMFVVLFFQKYAPEYIPKMEDTPIWS